MRILSIGAAIAASLLFLFLPHCSTDTAAGGDPYAIPHDTTNLAKFVADTNAVRAILDANGLRTISYFGVTAVDTAGRLSKLDLSKMGITVLPAAIESLTALTELLLYNNAIKVLPPQIGSLTKLVRLDLQRNSLVSLPPEIGNLAELQTFYAFGNNLTRLPVEIGRLARLVKLELANNQLDSLPGSIVRLQNLELVEVTNNHLCSVPPAIAAWLDKYEYSYKRWPSHQLCDSLAADTQAVRGVLHGAGADTLGLSAITQVLGGRISSLDLSHLGLDTLPSQIRRLTGVTALDLSLNDLDSLPSWLGALSLLVTLDLSRNNIAGLPSALASLKGLRDLDVSGNRLVSFPDSLRSIGGLRVCVAGNHLYAPSARTSAWLDSIACERDWRTSQTVPPSGATYAHYVADTLAVRAILDTNGLDSVAAMAVAQLNDSGRVDVLDLSGRAMGVLPETLGVLTGLRTLLMQQNFLDSLPSAVGKLTRLTTLKAHHNRLKAVPPHIGTLSVLSTLDLSDNGLKTLPAEVGALTALVSLELADNLLDSLPSTVVKLQKTTVGVANNRLCSPSGEVSAWLDKNSREGTAWRKAQKGCD